MSKRVLGPCVYCKRSKWKLSAAGYTLTFVGCTNGQTPKEQCGDFHPVACKSSINAAMDRLEQCGGRIS